MWRLALASGRRAGYTAEGYEALDLDGFGVTYLVALSAVTELAALLSLGLVKPWGERIPPWVPVFGDRAVSPKVAVTCAGLGCAILAVLWTPLLAWWWIPHDDLTTTGTIVVGALYLPLVAWAPLLAALAFDYRARHRRLTPAVGPGPGPGGR